MNAKVNVGTVHTTREKNWDNCMVLSIYIFRKRRSESDLELVPSWRNEERTDVLRPRREKRLLPTASVWMTSTRTDEEIAR